MYTKLSQKGSLGLYRNSNAAEVLRKRCTLTDIISFTAKPYCHCI